MARSIHQSDASFRFNSFVAIAVLCWPVAAAGQISDVTNVTSTPIPGVGHDYLHDMNEIVNPANGSVSIRIAAPTPHERGMNFPIYAYTYDSNGQFIMKMQATPVGCGNSNNGTYECTGADVWGPTLTTPSVWPSYPGAVSAQSISLSYNNGPNNGASTCTYTGNYIFIDLQGGRPPLGIQTGLEDQQGAGCAFFGVNANNYGGDIQYKAANWASGLQVIDSHGDMLGGGLTGGEDTNGNYRNGTGRPWSVTYGSGYVLYNPISMTVPGYSTPYTYTYGAAPGSATGLSSTFQSSVSSGTCNGPQTGSAGTYSLQQLNLPNGQYYKFGYDSVYGLVNSITYPTGAKVSYTWGLNTQSEMTGYIENVTIGAPVNMPSTCYYIHDWPAIQSREVYFDGVTPALKQTFSYTTTWSSGGANPYELPAGPQWWTKKTTTVTTTDLLRPGQPSYQTIYTYIPFLSSPQDSTSTSAASEIPLEAQVVYKDTSGNTLRTVTKAWNQDNQMSAECTTLPNGQTSGKFYTYESFIWPSGSGRGTILQDTDQVTDLQEYDYGSVAIPCQSPGATPARETKTTPALFGNTPYWQSGQYISDRPLEVQMYDHGTLISDTTYSYDQTAVASVSPVPIGHDETIYGASAAPEPRGNVTTVTKKCFAAGGTCTNAVTALLYDETGQVISVTDPRGATTTLSYADSYTTDDGSPPGNTNTYLTKITRPTTNSVAHVSNYQYDYEKGELRVATDENGQLSKYSYNDPWDRLTQANFPDSGQKNYTYDDAGPNPNVSTSTLMNSGGTAETSTTIMDGVGHVIETELTSDPSGADIVQNTYDGNGLLWTQSNPYRGSAPPPGTTTTYYYDSLGRKVEVVEQDGSMLQSCYDDIASAGQGICSQHLGSVTSGTWVDSSDENGNHWQRTSDSFGRLTEVMEPSGGSQSPSMETDYVYDMLDNLLTVKQCGALCSSPAPNGPIGRSFSYDSLSRLVTAQNPETGTICYGQWTGSTCANGYDPNGNLIYKTDARSVTTNYSYDALNRLNSKTYTNAPAGTLSNCYQYDTGTNQIGRLTADWTQAAACPQTAPTSGYQSLRAFAYDFMGRVTSEQQCVVSFCTSAAIPSQPTANCTSLSSSVGLQYCYDLAGDLLAYSNGVTTIAAGSYPQQALLFSQTFDAAG